MQLTDPSILAVLSTTFGALAFFGGVYRYNRDQKEHQRDRQEQLELSRQLLGTVEEIRDYLMKG